MIYQLLDSAVPVAGFIFDLSVKSSLLVIIILLIRTIFRYKLPPQWHYIFWFLVVFRLLIPFDMPSHSSIFNLINFNSSFSAGHDLTGAAKIAQAIPQNEIIPSAPLTPDSEYQLSRPVADSSVSVIHILVSIWIAGMVILSILVFRVTRTVIRSIKDIKPVSDGRLLKLFMSCKNKMHVASSVKLFELQDIKIPFIVGLFRPHIIIPVNARKYLKPRQLHHIFLHELAHYKRYDIASAWITTILTIIHWFNPVIWLAFYLMRVDREIACDSLALKHLKHERHKDYGKTILKLMENISINYGSPITVKFINNTLELRRRLKMLTHKSPDRNKWKLLIICLFLFISLVSFTKYVPLKSDSASTDRMDLSAYTVALVAGHGGTDAGGTGINGVKEKDLTLPIARKIKKELAKTSINAFLLRNDDLMIPLENVSNIIEKNNTDIAIYIHCNLHKNPAINGLETYYQKDIRESRVLDSLLHKHLALNTDFADGGSHTASFVVLKGTKIPSVLIETGYLSNKQDMERLEDDAFQAKIAFAVKDAALEYFRSRARAYDNNASSPVYVYQHEKFSCPTDSGTISSVFGNSIHPFFKNQRHHNGIDIKAAQGSAIYSVADGKIVFSGTTDGYGKMVRIIHPGGYHSFYAHMDTLFVAKGQKVKKDQSIGIIGNTGLSTGIHLHFELLHNGTAVDPMGYINTKNLKH